MQGSPTTKGVAARPIRGVKEAAPPVKRKVYAHEMPLLDLSEGHHLLQPGGRR